MYPELQQAQWKKTELSIEIHFTVAPVICVFHSSQFLSRLGPIFLSLCVSNSHCWKWKLFVVSKRKMWLECDYICFFPNFLCCMLLFCGVPSFYFFFLMFLIFWTRTACSNCKKKGILCFSVLSFQGSLQANLQIWTFFPLHFGLFYFVKAILMVPIISAQLLSFRTNWKLTAVLLAHFITFRFIGF